MNEHSTVDQLHDLVEGLLPPDERAAVEAHLAMCARCAEDVAAIRDVREALAALPREASAPQGLWAGIEARLDGDGARVVPLPVDRVRARGPRRFLLSVPQLAAAAALVALLSAGSVWMTLSRPGVGLEGGDDVVAVDAPVGPARMVASGEASYREAVMELEAILDAGRQQLAPETVEVLERSLTTIDQAIAEVREALRSDPASPLLTRMLVGHQGAKLRLLRQAASLVRTTI